MPDPVIHVARGEVEFGACTLAEAQEMVDAGFFLPTDQAWAQGMTGWRPLGETTTRLMAEGGDWRDKVVAGATGLSRVVGRGVGHFVAGVKSHAGQEPEAMSHAKKLALEQYVPQFQKLLAEHLRDKPVTIARSAVQNEAVMRNVFGALYACLPKPLHRLVPPTVFTTFCLEHRHRLLGAAAAATTASGDFMAAPKTDRTPDDVRSAPCRPPGAP